MADYEKELKDLRERNNELAQKVQYWKMTAAQRENEKLELMKEINELRLKLSRLRSGGAADARKLDSALQSASEEALSHMVQASSAVARILELAKTYMQDRQELDSALPRWSNLNNTPSTDKVNRVPPMLIGGRLMQPVVSLSRTLQSNSSRSVNRSPNQNRSITERAVPMHMLQDVYIPLTRIDRELRVNNVETEMDVNPDDSTEDLALDDSNNRIMEESENMQDEENFDNSHRLDAVSEDVEPEEETPPRPQSENPLEGPSWLLDEPRNERTPRNLTNLEPDSTTGFEESTLDVPTPGPSRRSHCLESAREFSPTVRKRRPSPPRSRRLSNNGRILKVLVAKMRLDEDDDVSPPKRPTLSPIISQIKPKKVDKRTESPKRPSQDDSPKFQVREMSPSKLMRFDAPSPNGSTDARVIVLETRNHEIEPCSSGLSNSALNRINNRADNDNRNSQLNSENRNNHIDNNDRDNSNNSDNHPTTDTAVNQKNASNNNLDTSPRCDNNSDRQDNNRNERTTQSRDNKRTTQSQDNKRTTQSRDNKHTTQSRDDQSLERESQGSDSSSSEMASDTRTRRPRKAVVYKEKPLNRKMRR